MPAWRSWTASVGTALLRQFDSALLYPLYRLDAAFGRPRSLRAAVCTRVLPLALACWFALFIVAALLYGCVTLSRSYRHVLSPSQRIEWLTRVVSNVNALAMTLISGRLVFGERALFALPAAVAGGDALVAGVSGGGLLDHEPVYFMSQFVFLAYFIYDLLLVLLFARSISSPATTILHHLFSIATVTFCMQEGAPTRPLPIYWVAAFTVTEASTPLVNARWFLSFRHRESRAYVAVGVGMLAVFVLARAVYIPWMTVMILRRARAVLRGFDAARALVFGFVAGVSTMFVYGLNTYWTVLMVRGAIKLVRRQTLDAKAADSGLPPRPSSSASPPEAAATPATTTARAVGELIEGERAEGEQKKER